jgi:hypothetical protein
MKSLSCLHSLFGRKFFTLVALVLMALVTSEPAHPQFLAPGPGVWMVESGCVDFQYNSCVHFARVWYNTTTGQAVAFHFTYDDNWVEYWN